MPAWITRLGDALPGPALAQADVADWLVRRLHPQADPQRLRRWCERSGVAVRHSVLDLLGGEGDRLHPIAGAPADMAERSRLFAERAPALAAAAVRDAVPDPAALAGITHLVVATCTGAVAPGLDVLLAAELGLSPRIRRTVVGFMGCHAAIPALRAARDAVLADPAARALVVCCELSSLHVRPGPDDDDLVAAALFGDGAAAALIESQPDGLGLRLGGDASLLVPDTTSLMAWTAGAQGFRLRLAPRLGSALAQALPGMRTELPAAPVRWAVHPGGPAILDEVEQALGLATLAASRACLRDGGNRSSGTVLSVLRRLAGEPWQGPCALLAFGPGLTADLVLVHR